MIMDGASASRGPSPAVSVWPASEVTSRSARPEKWGRNSSMLLPVNTREKEAETDSGATSGNLFFSSGSPEDCTCLPTAYPVYRWQN